MKSLVKPRWRPLLGWVVLVAAGLFSAYVFYAHPRLFVGTVSAPPLAPAGPDAVAQAMNDLEAIKASPWLRGLAGGPAGGSPDIIAPSPEAAAPASAAEVAEAVDPSLKGAVVVSAGKRLYLVLGSKRYRVGSRIGTGEEITALRLQSVDLISPEGRTRKVDIGRNISLPTEPFNW